MDPVHCLHLVRRIPIRLRNQDEIRDGQIEPRRAGFEADQEHRKSIFRLESLERPFSFRQPHPSGVEDRFDPLLVQVLLCDLEEADESREYQRLGSGIGIQMLFELLVCNISFGSHRRSMNRHMASSFALAITLRSPLLSPNVSEADPSSSLRSSGLLPSKILSTSCSRALSQSSSTLAALTYLHHHPLSTAASRTPHSIMPELVRVRHNLSKS